MALHNQNQTSKSLPKYLALYILYMSKVSIIRQNICPQPFFMKTLGQSQETKLATKTTAPI